MRKGALWTMLSLFFVVLGLGSAQADLIQCPGNGACTGTNNSDLINGTDTPDGFLDALDGDDVVFGNGDNDDIAGGDGNDIIFGGPGVDTIEGRDGNDILLAGPDMDQNSQQGVAGNEGTDAAFVFAGETLGCLFINGGPGGSDAAHLLGFGPYSATVPFGQPGFVDGAILVIDPITGGEIYILVFENNDEGTEIINGLPSPNVTIVSVGELNAACNPF